MSRTPAKFTQADIARALRAAKQVGASVAVEIDPTGVIRLIPYEAPPVAATFKSSVREPVEPKREFRL